MVDYSRFDHIGSDSDSGDDGAPAANVPKPSAAATALRPPAATGSTSIPPSTIGSASPQAAASSAGGGGSSSSTGGREKGGDVQGPGKSGYFPQPVMMTASNKGKEGRIKFEHEGKTVYEWEQSLEEVNLYIETPPGVKADRVDCKITPRHLRLGIKGNPPFLDEDTGGPVVVEESYWMMDGGELNVNLQKMKKAETWPSALQGKNTTVDPITLEGMQKKIMLERFQSENPGFDFSGAEFNGEVPDARSFMGGVKYT
ncbi:unnamed protein product [Pylaiella littoralis]